MKNDVYLISYFTELPFLQVCYKNTAQEIFSAFSDHFKLHFILKDMKLKKNMDFIRFLLEKHSKTVLEGLRIIIRHKDVFSCKEVFLFAREFFSACKHLIAYCFIKEYRSLNSALYDEA
jgi:hypothetical protein